MSSPALDYLIEGFRERCKERVYAIFKEIDEDLRANKEELEYFTTAALEPDASDPPDHYCYFRLNDWFSVGVTEGICILANSAIEKSNNANAFKVMCPDRDLELVSVVMASAFFNDGNGMLFNITFIAKSGRSRDKLCYQAGIWASQIISEADIKPTTHVFLLFVRSVRESRGYRILTWDGEFDGNYNPPELVRCCCPVVDINAIRFGKLVSYEGRGSVKVTQKLRGIVMSAVMKYSQKKYGLKEEFDLLRVVSSTAVDLKHNGTIKMVIFESEKVKEFQAVIWRKPRTRTRCLIVRQAPRVNYLGEVYMWVQLLHVSLSPGKLDVYKDIDDKMFDEESMWSLIGVDKRIKGLAYDAIRKTNNDKRLGEERNLKFQSVFKAFKYMYMREFGSIYNIIVMCSEGSFFRYRLIVKVQHKVCTVLFIKPVEGTSSSSDDDDEV